jgi:hypothetical protein
MWWGASMGVPLPANRIGRQPRLGRFFLQTPGRTPREWKVEPAFPRPMLDLRPSRSEVESERESWAARGLLLSPAPPRRESAGCFPGARRFPSNEVREWGEET